MKTNHSFNLFSLLLFSFLLFANSLVASHVLEEETQKSVGLSLKNRQHEERVAVLDLSHQVRSGAALSFYLLDALEEVGAPHAHNARLALLGALTFYELYALSFITTGEYQESLSGRELISMVFGSGLAYGESMMIYGNSLPYPPVLGPDAKALVRTLPIFVPAAASFLSYFRGVQ